MNARLLTVLLACLPAVVQANDLKHNPFARPALAPRPASAAPGAADSLRKPSAATPWKPELRAILAAGSKSFVNVEGAIVPLGEQIGAYRLIEVHEESAVFVNGNKRVTLSLRGTQAPAAAAGQENTKQENTKQENTKQENTRQVNK